MLWLSFPAAVAEEGVHPRGVGDVLRRQPDDACRGDQALGARDRAHGRQPGSAARSDGQGGAPPPPPLPADGTVENTDRLARIHREERKARKDTETQTGGDSRWSLCRSRYALAGVGETHQEAGSEVGPGVRVLQLRRPEAALQAGVLCGHGRERPQAAGRGARQTVRFHEVGVCLLAVQWSRS